MKLVIVFAVALSLLAVDLEHIVVHRDDTQYYITPWLARLASGELVLSAREAHRRRREHTGHVDPTARGILLRSRDGGRTWGNKVVVDDETYRFSQTEDVPVAALSDGSLLINLYSWSVAPFPHGFAFEDLQKGPGATVGRQPFTYTFEGLSTVRSTDNGRTWSPRQRVRVDGLPPLAARVPAVETPDRTLLLPVYGTLARGGRQYISWLIRSRDLGRTWGEPAVMAQDREGGVSFGEPCLLRKKDGGLLAMLRTEGDLYQTSSADGGKTWSPPAQSGLWGWPAHLLELRDGRILCTYGYRRAPFGVRAAISRDGGRTWDAANEIVLRSDGGNGDLGYPSSVEFDGGRVLTVYWMNHEKAGDAASEVRYIGGTFYKP